MAYSIIALFGLIVYIPLLRFPALMYTYRARSTEEERYIFSRARDAFIVFLVLCVYYMFTAYEVSDIASFFNAFMMTIWDVTTNLYYHIENFTNFEHGILSPITKISFASIAVFVLKEVFWIRIRKNIQEKREATIKEADTRNTFIYYALTVIDEREEKYTQTLCTFSTNDDVYRIQKEGISKIVIPEKTSPMNMEYVGTIFMFAFFDTVTSEKEEELSEKVIKACEEVAKAYGHTAQGCFTMLMYWSSLLKKP